MSFRISLGIVVSTAVMAGGLSVYSGAHQDISVSDVHQSQAQTMRGPVGLTELERWQRDGCWEEIIGLVDDVHSTDFGRLSPGLRSVLTHQDWHLLEARRYEHIGAWDAALQAFAKAAKVGGELTDVARLEYVKALYHASRYDELLTAAEDLRPQLPAKRYLRELFPLVIEASMQLDNHDAAEEHIIEQRRVHRHLSDRLVLRLWWARVEADRGRLTTAVEYYLKIIDARPHAPEAFFALDEVQELFERRSALREALSAEDIRDLAHCAFKRGDFDTSRQLYDEAIAKEMNPEKRFADRYAYGMTWYRADNFVEAGSYFLGLLETGSLPEAHHDRVLRRMAWCYRNMGSLDKAMELYAQSPCAVDEPDGCESIFLSRAFTTMYRGEYRTAYAMFETYLAEAGRAPMKADVRYYRGFLAYRMGRYGEAVEDLRHYLARHGKHAFHEEARLLLARSLSKLGKQQEAAAAAREFLGSTPESWHGPATRALMHAIGSIDGDAFEERAAAHVAEAMTMLHQDDVPSALSRYQVVSQQDPHLDAHETLRWRLYEASMRDPRFRLVEDMLEADNYALTDLFTAELSTLTAAQRHLRRGARLGILGYEEMAHDELKSAMRDRPSVRDLATMLPIARELPNQRSFLLICNRLHRILFADWPETMFHPLAMKLMFPPAYQDLTASIAAEYGLDHRLVLSLMWHESRFDRTAFSHAGAWGLTQFIPSTARATARELGLNDFRMEQMHEPEIAIRFACHYLNGLFERFDGRPELALAAYNGGPHNVQQWLGLVPEQASPEEFISAISFEETRNYVRKVMRGWHAYHTAEGSQPGLAWKGAAAATVAQQNDE